MNKEFLEGLGLPPETAEQVLQAHQQQMEKLRFSHKLERAVLDAGGRNVKAITALLEVESGEDIPGAVAAVKQECPYLFATAGTPYAPFTGGPEEGVKEPESLAAALKERFGL